MKTKLNLEQQSHPILRLPRPGFFEPKPVNTLAWVEYIERERHKNDPMKLADNVNNINIR